MLSRSCFMDQLNRYCLENSGIRTLVFVEINNAVQVARLVQGTETKEHLIDAVERLMLENLDGYDCESVAKIQHNQFGVVLNHSAKEALVIFEAFALNLDQQEVRIDGKTYYPKVMVGITPLTPEYRSAELAITAAEEALYQARRTGNSIVKLLLPDDEKLNRYLDSLKLLPVLRASLLNRAFVLYAQPIVPIIPQVVVPKSEILLRYKDSDGRIHSMDNFLRAAELFNVSREVDLYVLEQCCRFLHEMPTDTIYSMNISGATVRYPLFFETVKGRIQHYGINPEAICFEITENVADQDYEQASLLMYKLKNDLGCKLSLDDIGIGSSNLANLPKYDVDYFKIDGTFVQNLLTHSYAELVVRFIDKAAKLHNKQSVAEYVEQPLQLKKLQAMGVDYAQGNLTGKPEILFDPAIM